MCLGFECNMLQLHVVIVVLGVVGCGLGTTSAISNIVQELLGSLSE